MRRLSWTAATILSAAAETPGSCSGSCSSDNLASRKAAARSGGRSPRAARICARTGETFSRPARLRTCASSNGENRHALGIVEPEEIVPAKREFRFRRRSLQQTLRRGCQRRGHSAIGRSPRAFRSGERPGTSGFGASVEQTHLAVGLRRQRGPAANITRHQAGPMLIRWCPTGVAGVSSNCRQLRRGTEPYFGSSPAPPSMRGPSRSGFVVAARRGVFARGAGLSTAVRPRRRGLSPACRQRGL